MIGFGDPIFDRTAQIGTTPKVASLNRSLTAFYRGVVADTMSLADPQVRDYGPALCRKSKDFAGESLL